MEETQQSERGKKDKAWGHVKIAMENGKKVYICKLCDHIIRGGGINRAEQHFAGVKGSVVSCQKISADLQFNMKTILEEGIQKNIEKARGRANEIGSSSSFFDVDEEEDEAILRAVKARTVKKGKREARTTLHPFFTQGTFGRSSAVASRFVTRPDEWWKLFGGDYPKLQKFAIIILSQTTSSSGYERNWSVFERIQTKRRNRLKHKRLNDLVFVHYNLRLQNRLKDDKRSYDPVDNECISSSYF